MTGTKIIEPPIVQDRGPVGERHTITVNREAIEKEYTPASSTRPLSPAEHRKLIDENRWTDESDSAGADALYSSGRVTVYTDKELFEKERAKSNDELTRGAEERRAAATGRASAALASEFHAHAAKLQAMAAEAKGDPAKEARVTKQIAESAKVGAALKERGIL